MTRPVTPHEQLDHAPPRAVWDELLRRLAALPHVHLGQSGISLPTTTAFFLDPQRARGPREAFMPTGDTEFAHLHHPGDGSLHVQLPRAAADAVIAAGWGEWHPMARVGAVPRTTVMVYAPRDEAELEVVLWLVTASHRWASGADADLGRTAGA